MTDVSAIPAEGDRLAKVIARSGLCSRRDAEGWIKDGRVTVNGRKVLTPAFNVTTSDKIKVDGEPLAARQGTRVWLYHKPAGLVVTEKDPEGRPTIFEALAEKDLPRVVSIGRLDINTEGLLLVTNDGGLKRVLELPATGWLRRYRVRAFGTVTQEQLDTLKDGIEIEGIQYGPIEAILERHQGSNSWLVLGLREGKNREVKNVLGALGLQVNRLIRVSYGPFQLGDLAEGEVEVVAARVLKEQLGKRLASEAGADFDSDMPEVAAANKKRAADPRVRAAAPGTELKKLSPRKTQNRFRFEDDETTAAAQAAFEDRPRQDRPGGRFTKRPARPVKDRKPEPFKDERTVHFDDGTSTTIEVKPERRAQRDKGWDPDDSSARNFGRPAHHDERPARGPRGPRPDGDERPKKFGDKKPYGDKKPFARGPREDGDRPSRGGFGKKPYAPRNAEAGDRPPRKFGDKPFGSRPPRADGDRPARKFGDKPFGSRPPREDGDRPSRGGFGKKPYAPRNAEAGDRPPRKFGDKPYGTRPPREGGDRPARSYGDKPRSFSGKPDGRPGGKPFAGKPAGGRPSGGAGRPGGDKPRGPRKPRA
jgi:23S rRNA pseudouridine2605 synthase